MDGCTVKVARLVCSYKPGLIERYDSGLAEIVASLPHTLIEDGAALEGRLPFTPPALVTVGGKITLGKPTGDYVQDGKVLRQRTIYLYANGDYRLLNGGTEPDFNTGKIGYDPGNGSGMLMIHKTIYDLFNDTGTPAETYCFYGYDAAGVAMIYGHRGYPTVIDQVLRYAGPPDRPLPTEVADQAAKAEAAKREAERYKFVTVPSRGI